MRVVRLAEMNQVQDVATIFVPRLKLTVTLVSVQQAITQIAREVIRPELGKEVDVAHTELEGCKKYSRVLSYWKQLL